MLAEILHKIAAQEPHEEYYFYPRPSLAGPEKCMRQLVYSGLNTQKTPLPGRTFHIFDDGTFHEELVLDWLRKSAFQVHSEQMEIPCRPPMKKGHNDAIITDILGIDRLLELKAINHFTFQRFWAGELPLDYLTQCAIYIDGLQQSANPDLKEGILLIKNKNTAQYMEFLISYTFDTLTIIEKTHSTGDHEKVGIDIPDIVTDACQKFKSVLGYIKRQTLPKRQYDFDHWRCEYCQYGKTCWDGYEQEFIELKTDTMLSNEIADMVRYYRELGGQKKDIEKEYNTLSKKVKDMMKDAGAREGRAGEYVLKMKLIEQNRINGELLTDKEREKATVKTRFERLFISQPKEKEAA